jgi:hypothetical protein
MKRVAYAVWALLLTSIPTAHARAADAAIGAPVNCESAIKALPKGVSPYDDNVNLPASCGSDPSLTEAKVKTRRSWGNVAGLHLTTKSLIKHCGDDHPPWVWAPVAAFEDGEERLKYLLNLAKSGLPLDGMEVVEAKPQIPGEQHLALCAVSEGSGTPKECDTVAILTKSETWLRGDAIPPPPPPGAPPPVPCVRDGEQRISGGMSIKWTTQGTRDVELLSTSLVSILYSRQGLQAGIEPFAYDDDHRPKVIKVETSAPLRTSKTLPGGWREAFDFDVDFYKSDEPEAAVEIEGTLEAMVSRQAVGNQTEYHGLSDAQRNLYLITFDGLVEQSILNACPNGKKIDRSHIACN